MERSTILHLFTPMPQASPFDVNMAADAGYQVIVAYTGVDAQRVEAMTQDTIFSRPAKALARTAIFIGGRDVLLAAKMLALARRAMFKPFEVSLMADPSGAFTTAAAMLACVEAGLPPVAGRSSLAGLRVLVLGGTGPVGRIAGVIAARAGAEVFLSSRQGQEAAQRAADDTGACFDVRLHSVSGAGDEAIEQSLADADVLLACAAAGVQVVSAEMLARATRLRVAADVNAVPPAGIAGIEAGHLLQPLASGEGGIGAPGIGALGIGALGIGALAIGQVKYQTQHRLLVRMCESAQACVSGVDEAYRAAREVLAERSTA